MARGEKKLIANRPEQMITDYAKKECSEVVNAISLEQGAIKEYLEAKGEDRSEPAVKIIALPSEILPILSSAESPKRIAGWNPRSLKSDYAKHIKPVSSIHTTVTRISRIHIQVKTIVKQKTAGVLN